MVSNIFYVRPYLGKIPILTNIFQRGWNHQLVIVGRVSKKFPKETPVTDGGGWSPTHEFFWSLAKADTSRDGRIDFEEFQAIMQNKAAIFREENGKQEVTRWWFWIFFYFQPYSEKWSNLTNIFQMGWNHQLGEGWKKLVV